MRKRQMAESVQQLSQSDCSFFIGILLEFYKNVWYEIVAGNVILLKNNWQSPAWCKENDLDFLYTTPKLSDTYS